ncbi:hypothetical protein EVA_11561 [gut metagenome]|uniref:Uncharacterized protein n=1 Tax=gut metagenome TaxID=749906 RepID=J9CJS0_9ZZZZ
MSCGDNPLFSLFSDGIIVDSSGWFNWFIRVVYMLHLGDLIEPPGWFNLYALFGWMVQREFRDKYCSPIHPLFGGFFRNVNDIAYICSHNFII